MGLPGNGILRLHATEVRAIILTLVSAVAVFPCTPLFAQIPVKERMPNSEQDKNQMVDEVKKRRVPRPEFAYQGFQEAQGRAEDFAAIRDDYDGLLKFLDDSKATYPQSIAELKESAKSCREDTADELKSKLASLNGRPAYAVENRFKALNKHVEKILAQPFPQICDTLKKQATFEDLDQEFNAGFKEAITDVTTKRQWADELSKAWGEREKILEEESSKSVANVLTRDLWRIVLVLGAFVVGLLALARTFSGEIQMELVASGEIIQLPTVMLLLVTILILGLGAKIQENTIGTLLGGLAGYVLAQGVGRAAARAATGPGGGGAGAGTGGGGGGAGARSGGATGSGAAGGGAGGLGLGGGVGGAGAGGARAGNAAVVPD